MARWNEADAALGIDATILDDVGHLQAQAQPSAIFPPAFVGLKADQAGVAGLPDTPLEQRGRHDPDRAGHDMAIRVEFGQVAAVEGHAIARFDRSYGAHARHHIVHAPPDGADDRGGQRTIDRQHVPAPADQFAVTCFAEGHLGPRGQERRHQCRIIRPIHCGQKAVVEHAALTIVQCGLILDRVSYSAQKIGHAHGSVDGGRAFRNNQRKGPRHIH